MPRIYRSRITSEFKTQNMMNFYDKIGDGEDENTVYLMFGRSREWASNEDDINFAPPYPDDSPDGQAGVWEDAIGLIKIPKEQLRVVIPRRDWGDGDLGDRSLQFDIGDIVVTNTNSVNQHPSALPGYMVYRCIDVPDQGSCSLDDTDNTFGKSDCIALGGQWNAESSLGTTINIPNGTGDSIDTEDGYLWEYLYTIPTSLIINDVTREYIVAPFPEEIENNRAEWGLSNEVDYDRKVDRIIYSIGASTLRFRSQLTGDVFLQSAVPGNTGYRQISLIMNPILNRDNTTDPAVKATESNYLASDIEFGSGEMFYMENRQPIFRRIEQVEEFNLVFSF